MVNVISVYGYRCPENTSILARLALNYLNKFGCVVFRHDDGHSLLVRKELEKIADNTSLTTFRGQYRIVLIDSYDDYEPEINGCAFDKKQCMPLN